MSRTATTLTDINRYLSCLTTEPGTPGGPLPADRLRRAAELGAVDERTPVVAYFDLDRTLIAGYSITSLALEKMWSGSLSPRRIIAHAGIFLHWGLGRSDYHQLLEATVRGLVGMSEAEIAELGERAFENRIKPIIYQEGRALIDAHKALGHEPVIVTSATRYQTEPIARALGVEQIYCTELEISHGLITGNVTPCYGPGKKKAADVHMGFREAQLEDAFFYTDSCEDLPLLEVVGHPVAVNAKTSLRRIAEARGWPRLVFETTGSMSRARAA